MSIDSRIAALVPEITQWRQDMHRHPELDFDVHRAAAFVADKLREFGCDVALALIQAKRGTDSPSCSLA